MEFDEVYVVAGQKGRPWDVAQAGREPRRRRLKGARGRVPSIFRCAKNLGSRGRGTADKDKPPIFGMIQRGGAVILKMMQDVKQTSIKPVILSFVASGTRVHTDEYAIYARLPQWGYEHKTVNRVPSQITISQSWGPTGSRPHLQYSPSSIDRVPIMEPENTPGMRTATGFARSASTQWKASGPSCGHGSSRTGEAHKLSRHYIARRLQFDDQIEAKVERKQKDIAKRNDQFKAV